MRKPRIYVLKEYSNKNFFEEQRYQTEHVSRIRYSQAGFHIELVESNSLVEDKYSLNLNSAKYVVKGNITERKEAMIHHHPKGHHCRHLQFMLISKHETVRIVLEMLDDYDYVKCIKGFLGLSQKIIKHEQEINCIEEDIARYFFNEKISGLAVEERFLLEKVSQAFRSGGITDSKNRSVGKEKLEALKKETHLLPFLEWD